MSDLRGRSYSAVGAAKQVKKLATTISVAGTQAAIAALAVTMWRVNFNCKIIGCSLYFATGGTAAGPGVILQRSLAGTGTFATIGTFACGTFADATGGAMTVTETSCIAGDIIRLAVAAGTAASTPVIGSADLEFIEEFVTA